MAAITGSQTKLAIKKTTTFGTEVAVGALDAMGVRSFTIKEDADTLEGNSLGTGLVMETNTEKGNTRYSGSFSMVGGYENGFDMLLAQFFGAPAAPAEQTVGQGDYLHVLGMSTANANNGWLTGARTLSSGHAESYPSMAVTALRLSVGAPTAPLVADIDVVMDQVVLDSATNSVAVINAATLKDQTYNILVKRESEFLLDTEASGALASGDRVAITAWNLTLNRPLRSTPEIKGTPGDGEFASDGFVNGTLSVTMSKLDALTYFDAANNGTLFKSQLIVSGAAIGTGVNRMFKLALPRMRLLTRPDYNLADAGNNPQSMTWQIYAAGAAPTGFTSVYPQATLINTRTASY